MPLVYYIGKMLAGVAVFLLGISFMEEVLRRLAGRKFKLFLKKQTSHHAKAITGGAVVAGVLQSSSIVNLLVISLAGAGILQSANALAIILGSNLGSTVTNWIVGLLGFSYDTDVIAFPLAGITGICMAFFSRSGYIYKWCKLLFGFSFLFIGVGFIKEGMMDTVKILGVTSLANHSIFIFFLIGIVLTAFVQASSATMALVLAALYANVIPLVPAMAIVLGSEIGGTSKLFLVSLKGDPIKKRIALGNFIFNAVTAILVLIFLRPVYHAITNGLHISDQLLALVLFQTLVNVAAIILFYPLLNLLGKFLETIFDREGDRSRYINKIKNDDPEAAIEAMDKETRRFIFTVVDFLKEAFDIKGINSGDNIDKHFRNESREESYHQIKHLYGEIHEFYIRLQKNPLSLQLLERLEQLSGGVRNGMYAAKNTRDMWQDIGQLRNSSNDTKYNFYTDTRQKIILFSEQIHSAMEGEKKLSLQNVTGLYSAIQSDYAGSLKQLYKESTASSVNETEITTLLNFNRELYTALKSLMFAAINYLLKPEEAGSFDKMPGFIR